MDQQQPAGEDPACEGDIRHYLQHHIDPSEPGAAILAAVYLAGRADLIDDINAGFQGGEHPTSMFTRAEEADAEIARRFGLEPSWSTGLPADYRPAAPTLEELIQMQKALARHAN